MAENRPVVLITGCSAGGIGAALCVSFQKRGYTVFATARNTSKIPSSLLSLPNVHSLVLDVTVASSIAEAVEAVHAQTLGRGLDVLVNNSGTVGIGPLQDVELDYAKDVFDVNLWAPLAMVKAFSQQLIKNRGTVVNVSSIASQVWLPYQGEP